MPALLAFAFVSGIVTILSPCILPVLPIVLAGSVGGGKARPLGVITGFIVSFTTFTLALTAIVDVLGIPSNTLRIAAVVIIVTLGLTMIIPRLRDGFELVVSRLTSRSGGSRRSREGFLGGIPVGLSLGLVWTPCVGAIMASVIALALTRSVDGGAIVITAAYAIGTAIPMIAIMFGGRALLTKVPALSKRAGAIQRGFGVVTILAGLAIGFGLDLRFQSAILNVFPNYGSGLTAIEDSDVVLDALDDRGDNYSTGAPMMSAVNVSYDSLAEQPKNGHLGDYGPAPELVARGDWLNRQNLMVPGVEDAEAPIRMSDLLGKVVVIDFWTYSCVNCVRTIPHLKSWYDAFKDEEFVIIGIHTPEFEFEKSTANVTRAMKSLGIEWPVIQDNTYSQWRAYNNRYWPAKYFIDAEGHIRYFHYGEGEYDTSERVIRALLLEAGTRNFASDSVRSAAEFTYESRTPESYLGYERSEGFISTQPTVAGVATAYTASAQPGNGEWSLDGIWEVSKEFVASSGSGTLNLGFHAKHVYLVIEPVGEGGEIEVLVDGTTVEDTADVVGGRLIPDESRLYRLVELDKPGNHVLSLEVRGELRLFAFTFG